MPPTETAIWKSPGSSTRVSTTPSTNTESDDENYYRRNMKSHKRLWAPLHAPSQFSKQSLKTDTKNITNNCENINNNKNKNKIQLYQKNQCENNIIITKNKNSTKLQSLPVEVAGPLEKSPAQPSHININCNYTNIETSANISLKAKSRSKAMDHQLVSCYLLDLRQTYINFRKVIYTPMRQLQLQQAFGLVALLLLGLTVISPVHTLAIGLDPANANLTDLGSPAPKYQTAYACEGKKLTIECEPGQFISLIRANYGRFSITICNDHGNVEWSVNCMFSKTLSVLNSRCASKQSCTVLATTAMFGDPCPGTHKYLEAHYQCVSAIQTTTTTHRPSPPPWVLNQPPPILPNIIGGLNSSYIKPPGLLPPPIAPQRLPQPNNAASGFSTWQNALQPSIQPPTVIPPNPEYIGRPLGPSANANIPPPPPSHPIQPQQQQHHHHHHNNQNQTPQISPEQSSSSSSSSSSLFSSSEVSKTKTTAIMPAPPITSTASNTRILSGVGGSGSDDNYLLTTKSIQNRFQQNSHVPTTLPTGGTVPLPTESGLFAKYNGSGTTISRTVNNVNPPNMVGAGFKDETSMFCGPVNARSLFWNITRVGDVNVQPCPGGAAGIAKWRCVLMKRYTDLDEDLEGTTTTQKPCLNATQCNSINQMNRLRNFEPTWHPLTPDLTQCRSLWLNSLEMRVNQRDTSLISIANELSEVTSKTLYGGDMLVTTKIIQTMSEKMFHDKETFPDQRQREAIILELLHGVVKTGSNLLDESQLPSWLDLNQEDQMRVATSLLTGLEYNAFLLADTIIREVNVVQKVKNILLSVRVLETKHIQNNVVFPDAEQWEISNDRIELPKASLLENSEGGLVRVVFAAFDRLESILKPTYDHYDLKSARSYVRNTALSNDTNDENSNGEQRIRILNSKVISASLGKGRHIQLSKPIKLIFKHLKVDNVTNPTCVFWNYIDHAWSANGCSLEATNRTHSICSCNHLTNFALLMDVVDEHSSSLFSMFDGNMRLLIYISIAICIIFIVIALLTLKIFNGVFTKNARTSIYRNIYICLFVIECLFLCGIEQSDTSIFCGFITTFLHCAVLAGIAWFCFEAFQTYTTLTTDDLLMEVDQTAKVNCYYLLSYGLSLTIVAISLIIDPNSYTQNDYCVLMEAKIVFYGTFVGPVAIFLMGAITYTIISWTILCRRTRTSLKNKEHSRLASIRFDTRCSFIFLLLFSAVWLSAYFYLRQSKADDEMAIIYGYLFVGFNSLMGLYIFVFHCIQNEKIRREYRKYVRQNSWLPKCLRCSKTSISSGGGGGGASGGVGGLGGSAGGNINSNTMNPGGTISSNTTSQGGVGGMIVGGGSKKSKLNDNEHLNGHDLDDDACTAAADDAIIPSSDCELNEPAHIATTNKRTGGSLMHQSVSQNLKSGILPGSLVIEHSNGNSDSTEGNIILARGSSTPTTTATGTLRSLNGVSGGGGRTPSAGHTSPTSSAGSTHLIFGHGHKQQQMVGGGPLGGGLQAEAYYHQPDYYYKQPAGGNGVGGNGGKGMQPMHLNYYGNASSVSPSQHPNEFFYWTQKQHGKKKRGNGNMRAESPSGSLHSRTTASSQQMLFYPSYKKNPMKSQQHLPPGVGPQGYPHYSEAIEPNTYYQTQPHRRYHPQQQQQTPPHKYFNPHHQQQQHQQQLSSDDEQMENAAHSRLLHLNRSRSGGGGVNNIMGIPQIPIPPPPTQPYHPHHLPPHHNSDYRGSNSRVQTPSRYYHRNKHSSNDVNQDYDGGRSLGGNSDSYYNHGSMGGDGPVYEEIMSNRSSDIHHYDVGDMLDYNTERNYDNAKENERAFSRNRNFLNGSQRRNLNHPVDDDLDRYNDHDDADDDSEDDSPVLADDMDDDDANVLPQSDERMRRLMAMQDEDFKRRFQRQQRKKAAAAAALAAATAVANDGGTYHEPYDPQQFQKAQPQQPQTPQKQQQTGAATTTGPQQQTPLVGGGGGGKPLAVFGVSGGGVGGEGSVRSFKRSPSGRLAINEIFQMPTTNLNLNQEQQQKRQQQQQQPLSPQSTTSSTSQQQQQQPRNISAMLDENNTVRCYLEPLAK